MILMLYTMIPAHDEDECFTMVLLRIDDFNELHTYIPISNSDLRSALIVVLQKLHMPTHLPVKSRPYVRFTQSKNSVHLKSLRGICSYQGLVLRQCRYVVCGSSLLEKRLQAEWPLPDDLQHR
jgi:hypothetical protein